MGCKTSVDSIYNLISLQKSSSIYLVSSFTGWITHCLGSVPWSALRNFTNTNQGKVFSCSRCFPSHDYTYRVSLLTGRKYDLCVLHRHRGIMVFSIPAWRNKDTDTHTRKYKWENINYVQMNLKKLFKDQISLCTRGCKVAMNSILQILLNRMRRHKKPKGEMERLNDKESLLLDSELL